MMVRPESKYTPSHVQVRGGSEANSSNVDIHKSYARFCEKIQALLLLFACVRVSRFHGRGNYSHIVLGIGLRTPLIRFVPDCTQL